MTDDVSSIFQKPRAKLCLHGTQQGLYGANSMVWRDFFLMQEGVGSTKASSRSNDGSGRDRHWAPFQDPDLPWSRGLTWECANWKGRMKLKACLELQMGRRQRMHRDLLSRIPLKPPGTWYSRYLQGYISSWVRLSTSLYGRTKACSHWRVHTFWTLCLAICSL